MKISINRNFDMKNIRSQIEDGNLKIMEQKKENKNRENYIDAISAILIIYMILLHIFQMTNKESFLSSFYMKILFFFMPWFFFKAGMYFKCSDWKTVIAVGLKRLIIPYLVFSLIGYVVQLIEFIVTGDNNWGYLVISPIAHFLLNGALWGNLALWFLLSLFFVRLLLQLIVSRNISFYAASFVSLFIAFALHFVDFRIPLYIANTCSGLFFALCGYHLRYNQFKRKWVIIGLIAYLYNLFISKSGVDMFHNQLGNGYYLVWIFASLGGCITINNLFKYMSLGNVRLNVIGKDAMSYYVMHYALLSFLSVVFKYITNSDNSDALFAIMLVSCLVVLPILNRLIMNSKFRWIVGM